MRRILFTFIVTIILFSLPKAVQAEEIAGRSATMAYNTTDAALKQKDLFIKKMAIKRVLEKYDSPLARSVNAFMDSCVQYDLNCYLLPSITGLESTFGKFIYPDSYNGFGWDGGYMKFASWEAGINIVAQGLRQNYIGKGAKSVYQIGFLYSESPTWALRVQYFMNQFVVEEQNLQLLLDQKTVQL